jgi:hypothetical protein
MLAQINAWGLLSAGYVYRGLYLFGVGREGARQRCLGRLLQDLSTWGVTQLVIESRRPRENTFDAMTIIPAVRSMFVPAGLSLTYGWASKREPMLWVADAVAGAVRANLGPPGRVTRGLITVVRRVI